MRQLSSLDAQFLAVESARIYGHVAFLGIYDPSTAPGGRLDMRSVTKLLRERLHLLPPLRWRLVEVPLGLDLPYWAEDPDFDLDFHVRETALPPPGDDRQLAETVARVFGRPLDRRHPLWELYVIHGLTEGRVALLTKIHHSVVDGISGNEIMAALLDPEPAGREIPPPAPQPPAPPVPSDREHAPARPARHPAPAAARRCARSRTPSPASPTCRAPTRSPACRPCRASTRAPAACSAPRSTPGSSR